MEHYTLPPKDSTHHAMPPSVLKKQSKNQSALNTLPNTSKDQDSAVNSASDLSHNRHSLIHTTLTITYISLALKELRMDSYHFKVGWPTEADQCTGRDNLLAANINPVICVYRA
jgi:hypothetical protein